MRYSLAALSITHGTANGPVETLERKSAEAHSGANPRRIQAEPGPMDRISACGSLGGPAIKEATVYTFIECRYPRMVRI